MYCKVNPHLTDFDTAFVELTFTDSVEKFTILCYT